MGKLMQISRMKNQLLEDGYNNLALYPGSR